MASKGLDFSSPEPTGAIISQFFVALQKCFELKTGEFVYIEIDGDVSLISRTPGENVQAEVKEYTDDLTDSAINFWNTLKNWLSDSFTEDDYKSLVFITTQSIGKKSSFEKWPESSRDEKLKILEAIYTKAKERHEKSKRNATVSSKPEPQRPEALKLMDFCLDKSKEPKLNKIVGKISIVSEHPTRNEISNTIIERELKAIPEHNKQRALRSLLGNIIASENYNKGWIISSESFNKELEDIVLKNIQTSVIFPDNPSHKTLTAAETEELRKHLFVSKIEDIEYPEVVADSVKDYFYTVKTIMQEFDTRTRTKESISRFQDDLKEAYKPAYRKACRGCSEEDLISKSKDFFDDTMKDASVNIDLFNSTPLVFKNGMYHMLANEEHHNISWKLKSGDE